MFSTSLRAALAAFAAAASLAGAADAGAAVNCRVLDVPGISGGPSVPDDVCVADDKTIPAGVYPPVYGQTFVSEQGKPTTRTDLCASYYRSKFQTPGTAPAGWPGAPVVIILAGGGGTPYGDWQKAYAKWFARRGYVALVPFYLTPPAGTTNGEWKLACPNSYDFDAPRLAAYQNCIVNDAALPGGWVQTYPGKPAPTGAQLTEWCTQRATNTVVATDGVRGWNAATREAQRNVQTLIRTLKKNPAHFGVDPSRITVIGESFGGITALRTAMRSEDFGEADGRVARFASSSTLSDPVARAAENKALSKPWRVVSIAAGECYPGMEQSYRRENVPIEWGGCQWKGDASDTPFLMANGGADVQATPAVAGGTCLAASVLTGSGHPLCARMLFYASLPGGAADLPAGAVCARRVQTNPITGLPYGTALGGDHYIGECEWRSGITRAGRAAAVQTTDAIACSTHRFVKEVVSPTGSQPNCNTAPPEASASNPRWFPLAG